LVASGRRGATAGRTRSDAHRATAQVDAVAARLSSAAPAIALAIAVALPANADAAPQMQPANAAGVFGLYPATAFRLTTGTCGDCPAIRQALWYFRDQPIVVPLADHPLAKFE